MNEYFILMIAFMLAKKRLRKQFSIPLSMALQYLYQYRVIMKNGIIVGSRYIVQCVCNALFKEKQLLKLSFDLLVRYAPFNIAFIYIHKHTYIHIYPIKQAIDTYIGFSLFSIVYQQKP